jgi:hypothetical protein
MFDEAGVLLPASEFLPIAEKMGLTRKIHEKVPPNPCYPL